MKKNQLQLKIHNNLTRKKEEFRPLVDGHVKFYSCGPTPYDFLHIGNARAHIVADLFYRVLCGLGYQVTYVRNYTDIDDKIIARSKEAGRDSQEHAELFIKECEKDMASIGLLKPNHTPKVTETMKEIVEMISTLLAKGAAYEVDGEVLYHVPSFTEYGKLSRKDLSGQQAGIRVQVEEHKKHPADFVLWKPSKKGEPAWDSPWGPGRPGWHIECSAMALKFLGKSIDLHHGGIDLQFPHHENEIAQSEMANGQVFCQHWCHNEFLNFAEEKMSKSLGNVITIRKFVESYSGLILRQVFISCHYRTRLEWSEELIERAIHDLERIHQFLIDLEKLKKRYEPVVKDESERGSAVAKDAQEITQTIELMKEELANDFNTPAALAHFFTMIRRVRRDFMIEGKDDSKSNLGVNKEVLKAITLVCQFVDQTLGILSPDPQKVFEDHNRIRQNRNQKKSEAEIEKLVEERRAVKEQKNWALADEIRNRLKAEGIELKDHPDGTTSWKFQ